MTSKKNKAFRKTPREKRGMLACRAAILAKGRRAPFNPRPVTDKTVRRGYDPELLFVECAHCGAPVLWEEGKASALLAHIGVDPLELDPYCLLLTDGCPECSPGARHKVRILRLGLADGLFSPGCGHA